MRRGRGAALLAAGLGALAALGGLGATRAQEAAPEAPTPAEPLLAAPPPELDQLAGLVGRWRCVGRVNPSPLGVAHETQGRLVVARARDGWFYTARYEGKRSRHDPLPRKVSDLIGWDAAARQFVRTQVDNGGAWAHLAAAGWEDDALVFSGELTASGVRLAVRQTWTRGGRDGGELRASVELAMPPAGKDKPPRWIPLVEETCKR